MTSAIWKGSRTFLKESSSFNKCITGLNNERQNGCYVCSLYNRIKIACTEMVVRIKKKIKMYHFLKCSGSEWHVLLKIQAPLVLH